MTPPRYPTQSTGVPIQRGTGRHETARDDYFDMSDDISQVTMPDTRNLASARSASTSFLIALSVILGVLISAGVVVGVLGKAFYVQRDEFTAKSLKDAQDSTIVQQTLTRLENALSRQEAAFDRMSDTVQTMKLDMARVHR
jgi:uncharacterized protein HemX